MISIFNIIEIEFGVFNGTIQSFYIFILLFTKDHHKFDDLHLQYSYVFIFFQNCVYFFLETFNSFEFDKKKQNSLDLVDTLILMYSIRHIYSQKIVTMIFIFNIIKSLHFQILKEVLNKISAHFIQKSDNVVFPATHIKLVSLLLKFKYRGVKIGKVMRP